ncbi:MAG: hypothetical protein EB088_13725, partial [Betaproteobacteria bacterium]|nr:hypothetical protein [Betaproteobacteria bacterium]
MPGYPSKLLLYKTAASRFFWVRFYFHGRYFYKSTQTESVKDARRFAVDFYEDCLVNAKERKVSDTSRSFAVVGQQFLKIQSDNEKIKTTRNDAARFRNDLLPFFGEQDITTITNAQISQFLERLRERKLSPATQKHFLVVLSKIMRFAIENDLMMRMPTFPRVAGRLKTSQSRDYFSHEEYDKLVETAERCAKEGAMVRGTTITLEMKFLIQFMVNSFIRPSDLRVIKFQHLHHRKEKGEEHPATKTTATEVQAMPVTVHIIRRYLEFLKSENRQHHKDDYLFFSGYTNRDTAMAVIARQFRHILEQSGIVHATGKTLTLYSLRHTAIMLRLTYGKVDTLHLARNARTSQQMIDQFYARNLTTDQVRKQL